MNYEIEKTLAKYGGEADKGVERTCGNCICYDAEAFRCCNAMNDDETGFYKETNAGCWYHMTEAEKQRFESLVSKRKERFTTGPWEVWDNRDKDTTEHDYAVGDKDGWLVAEIGNDSIDIEEANAALMAAAPEMYEELEKTASFLRFVAKWIEGQHGIIAIGEALKYKAEIIDKLLAKARGEVRDA